MCTRHILIIIFPLKKHTCNLRNWGREIYWWKLSKLHVFIIFVIPNLLMVYSNITQWGHTSMLHKNEFVMIFVSCCLFDALSPIWELRGWTKYHCHWWWYLACYIYAINCLWYANQYIFVHQYHAFFLYYTLNIWMGRPFEKFLIYVGVLWFHFLFFLLKSFCLPKPCVLPINISTPLQHPWMPDHMVLVITTCDLEQV